VLINVHSDNATMQLIDQNKTRQTSSSSTFNGPGSIPFGLFSWSRFFFWFLIGSQIKHTVHVIEKHTRAHRHDTTPTMDTAPVPRAVQFDRRPSPPNHGHSHVAKRGHGHGSPRQQVYGHSVHPHNKTQFPSAPTAEQAAKLKRFDPSCCTGRFAADMDDFYAPLGSNYHPAFPTSMQQSSQLDTHMPLSEESSASWFAPQTTTHVSHVAARNPAVPAPSERERLLRQHVQKQQRRVYRLRGVPRAKAARPEQVRLLEISDDKPFQLDASSGYDIFLMTSSAVMIGGSIVLACLGK